MLDIRLAEHGTALANVRRQEGVLEQAVKHREACEEEYREMKEQGLTIADAMKYETGIEVLERTVQRETEKLRAAGYPAPESCTSRRYPAGI